MYCSAFEAIAQSGTTTIRKMSVNAVSTSVSAISFGVRCRIAPSTSAIIRSRNESPGAAVIRTTMRSERTSVPPVTPERSPPASRITGADSPVIADSSTDAMPSTISPSPGINSHALTSTRSPVRNFELGTFSTRVPPSSKRLAVVSERALRNVSACALPRPSAMASAKFANSTVNHNHRVIWRLNLKSAPPLKSSAVVITLLISTTNMTGLPIIFLGFSLSNASQRARRTIFHSQIALAFFAIVDSLERLARGQEQVLKDRAQTQRREKGERSHNQDRADQQHGEKRRGHRKSSQGWRNVFLARQIAGNSQHRNDHQETAREHRQSDGGVVPECVYGESSEGRAVVRSSRNVGVEHFA